MGHHAGTGLMLSKEGYITIPLTPKCVQQLLFFVTWSALQLKYVEKYFEGQVDK